LLLHLKNAVRNFQAVADKEDKVADQPVADRAAASVAVDKVAVDNAADKGEEHQQPLQQIN
jgi:hypothetical protein